MQQRVLEEVSVDWKRAAFIVANGGSHHAFELAQAWAYLG
jgi:hypothetical protein